LVWEDDTQETIERVFAGLSARIESQQGQN